jgi:branched-subunit amino acid transport protein
MIPNVELTFVNRILVYAIEEGVNKINLASHCKEFACVAVLTALIAKLRFFWNAGKSHFFCQLHSQVHYSYIHFCQ